MRQPPARTYGSRREKLRELCEGGLLILYRGDTGFHENLYYLTGLNVPNTALLLSLDTDIEVGLVSSIDEHAARAQSGFAELQVSRQLTEDLARIVGDLKPARVHVDFGSDSQGEAIGFVRHMAGILPKTEFETAPAQLVTMRATKDVWEIGCLHNAALNGRAALDAAVGALAPGVSELEVAAEAMAVLVRNGATRPAMPIVAFGENTVHPHHIPTDRCLSAGDVVLLDVYGEAADNYCCDLTETLVWGTADPEAERGIDAVREVQEEIAGKLRKGVTLAQIDAWVGEALDRRALGRYYLGRACHLLGLSEHDPLSEDRGLEEGAVFALEPGVYDLGRRHGVRVERTYLIRQAGAVDLEWRTGTF